MSLDLQARVIDILDIIEPGVNNSYGCCALAMQLPHLVSAYHSFLWTNLIPVFLDHRAWRWVTFKKFTTDYWTCVSATICL